MKHQRHFWLLYPPQSLTVKAGFWSSEEKWINMSLGSLIYCLLEEEEITIISFPKKYVRVLDNLHHRSRRADTIYLFGSKIQWNDSNVIKIGTSRIYIWDYYREMLKNNPADPQELTSFSFQI